MVLIRMICGLLSYAVVLFRSRLGDKDSEPTPVCESVRIGTAWTASLIPLGGVSVVRSDAFSRSGYPVA